jgi:hypothetical protein
MWMRALPVAVEAGQYALATALLMVVAGLAVVGVAIARGLAAGEAIHAYLWGGLWFVVLWFALMLLFVSGVVVWRRARKRVKRRTLELPDEIRIASLRDTWLSGARSQAPTLAFLAFAALVSPRLACVLAGFSLLGIGLVPVWVYRRFGSSEPLYMVRGPGRRQRQWYVRPTPT